MLALAVTFGAILACVSACSGANAADRGGRIGSNGLVNADLPPYPCQTIDFDSLSEIDPLLEEVRRASSVSDALNAGEVLFEAIVNLAADDLREVATPAGGMIGAEHNGHDTEPHEADPNVDAPSDSRTTDRDAVGPELSESQVQTMRDITRRLLYGAVPLARVDGHRFVLSSELAAHFAATAVSIDDWSTADRWLQRAGNATELAIVACSIHTHIVLGIVDDNDTARFDATEPQLLPYEPWF